MSQPDPVKNGDCGSQKSSRAFFAVVCLAFALLLFEKAFFWWGHPLLAFPDQAAYLQMAELITKGKLPYVDFFEWNPPLIMYLNLIPVLISGLYHIPPILSLDFSVLGLCALSTFLSLRIACRYLSKDDFVTLLPMFFAFVYVSQSQLPNMGEREHLFVLTYLPFFILRGIVWQGNRVSRVEAVICGLIAGIGIALKPQFFASVALVEFCFFIQYKNLRCFVKPEIFAAAFVCCLYLVCLLLLPAPAWDAYIHQVVPLYLAGLQYSSRAVMLMLRADANFYNYFAQLIVTLPIAIVLSRQSTWIAPLGAFSLSFLFHYIYGDQAWTYRFLPMTASLFMLDGLLLGMLLKKLLTWINLPRLTDLSLCCALLCIASLTAYREIGGEIEYHENAQLLDMTQVGYQGTTPRQELSPLVFSIMSNTKPNDSVIFIGTGIDPGFPAILQSGRQIGTRYIFSILALIDYCWTQTEDQKWQKMAELVISNYGQDILTNKPAVIIIQAQPMNALLKDHQFFVRFMDSYKNVGSSDLYEIWVRSGEPVEVQAAGDRQQIIIDILANKITIESAAKQTGLEPSRIERLVYLARLALTHSLSQHAAEQQSAMEAEIAKLNERIKILRTENSNLQQQVDRLQKK